MKNMIGTRFRLKSFRIHGGGSGSYGTIIAVDKGKRWDNYARPIVVSFDDCPKRQYRLSINNIEILRTNIKSPNLV